MSNFFSKAFLFKFIKFGIVGFTGLIVDFGITYICKEHLKIQKYISNAIGFTLAASSNYVLNRIWTFHSSNPHILEEYSKFITISIIGLAINTLILFTLVKKWKFNFYIAKCFAVGTVTIYNFLANNFITFV